MTPQRIVLAMEDQREGLRLVRAQKMAHDAVHVAENEFAIWAAQMGAMYSVPDGYVLSDVIVGYVPAGEQTNGS